MVDQKEENIMKEQQDLLSELSNFAKSLDEPIEKKFDWGSERTIFKSDKWVMKNIQVKAACNPPERFHKKQKAWLLHSNGVFEEILPCQVYCFKSGIFGDTEYVLITKIGYDAELKLITPTIRFLDDAGLVKEVSEGKKND